MKYKTKFWMYNYQKKIINLYLKGKTISEVAEIIGCSLKPIRKILKKKGIIRTDINYFKKGNNFGSLNKNMNLRKKKDEVVKYYLEGIKSTKEICKFFNLCNRTFYTILRENNVKFSKERNRKIKTEDIIKSYLNGKFMNEIAKELGVTCTLTLKRLKKAGIKIREKDYERIGKKISKAKKERNLISPRKGKTWEKYFGIEKAEEIKKKTRKARAKQIFPRKDTTIEIKIQNFLKQLGIEFFTHQHMKINHSYRCDIFIPVQKGIPQKTILECDGDYWHGNREIFSDKRLTERILNQGELDDLRTKELIEKGFKVLRLWENEIKEMELSDFKIKLIS